MPAANITATVTGLPANVTLDITVDGPNALKLYLQTTSEAVAGALTGSINFSSPQ